MLKEFMGGSKRGWGLFRMWLLGIADFGLKVEKKRVDRGRRWAYYWSLELIKRGD